MNLSIAIHTWNRPPEMLENSLWTLSNQTVTPDEIVVSETSPTEATHEATRELCAKYPLVKLVEGYWSRINVSRAANVAIRGTRPESRYVAVVGMELLFSPNFVEVLLEKLQFCRYNRAACCTLGEDMPIESPQWAWDNWDMICDNVREKTPLIAPGAVLCASRAWWFWIRGFDEARRPFSYPDVDIHNRAYRCGMNLEDGNVDWTEAQVIHPWHPPSGFFYSISGHQIDPIVDADVRRNDYTWGKAEGGEWARIAGT